MLLSRLCRAAPFLIFLVGAITCALGLSLGPVILVNGAVWVGMNWWRRLAPENRAHALGGACAFMTFACGLATLFVFLLLVYSGPMRTQMRWSHAAYKHECLTMLGVAVAFGLATGLFARWSSRLLPRV